MKRIHIRFARCIVASVTALACVGLFPLAAAGANVADDAAQSGPQSGTQSGAQSGASAPAAPATPEAPPRLVRGRPRPGHLRDARGYPGLVGRRSPDARPGAARTG